jgi:glycosyltransferase involved in cell wall biosynthesis
MARVLIILPAYNEQATIGAVLDSIRTHAPGCDVLVIDDGSKDETAAVVRSMNNAALARLPYNLGIGAAMQTGFQYAVRNNYDIAVQCDSDGQHPVQEIPRLVRMIEEGVADVVIGSRYVADSGYQASLTRRMGKSFLSRLIDALIGGGITDTTSGFRAVNRRALAVFAEHYPDDYPEPESLIILHRAGLKAAETPVIMQQRQGGISSINAIRSVYYLFKVALAIIIDLFRKFPGTPGAT